MTALDTGVCGTVAFALMLGGCTSLGQGQVSAMSTLEICEMQVNQTPNLTEESRRLLASELGRRKEGCAPHRAEIQKLRDDDLYEHMYKNWSP